MPRATYGNEAQGDVRARPAPRVGAVEGQPLLPLGKDGGSLGYAERCSGRNPGHQAHVREQLLCFLHSRVTECPLQRLPLPQSEAARTCASRGRRHLNTQAPRIHPHEDPPSVARHRHGWVHTQKWKQGEMCTPVFMAALLTTAKRREPPSVP